MRAPRITSLPSHALHGLYNRSAANTPCRCWVTTRRYSPICFTSSTTIHIRQDQQIVLNCQCPIPLSNVDTILRPAIRIMARADNQFRQSADDPFTSVSRNLIFVPLEIFTHIFTACSPSALNLS